MGMSSAEIQVLPNESENSCEAKNTNINKKNQRFCSTTIMAGGMSVLRTGIQRRNLSGMQRKTEKIKSGRTTMYEVRKTCKISGAGVLL